MTVELLLSASGSELLEKIQQSTGLDRSRLKIICKGRVVVEDKSLQEQSIRVGFCVPE